MTDEKDNHDENQDSENLENEIEDSEIDVFSDYEEDELFEAEQENTSTSTSIEPLSIPEEGSNETTVFGLDDQFDNSQNDFEDEESVDTEQEEVSTLLDTQDIDGGVEDDNHHELFDDFNEQTQSDFNENPLHKNTGIDIESQVDDGFIVAEEEEDISAELDMYAQSQIDIDDGMDDVDIDEAELEMESENDPDNHFNDHTKEISRSLIQPTGEIPPTFKHSETNLDENEFDDQGTKPHNPMFTPMDSLTEVPHAEDFDENTGGYDEISGSEIYLPESSAISAKERFEKIKNGVVGIGAAILNNIKSLKGGNGGGGNGGGGDDDDEFDEEASNKKDLKSLFLSYLRSFDWDKLFKNIFSPESRTFHHNAFLITLFLFTSYYSGKFVGSFLTIEPKSSKKLEAPQEISPQQNYNAALSSVAKNNLFNTLEHTAPSKVATTEKKETKVIKEEEKNIICREAEQQTNLPLKLKNTVVLQDSVKSIASVQLRNDSNFEDFREGDLVENIARIEKIDRLRVVLKNLNSGECEFIANLDEETEKSPLAKTSGNILSPKEGKKLMESTTAGIQNEGNSYKIKKETRDKMLENLDQLLTQARAIQIKNSDGSLSFKMTEIVPGSFYSQLDIQDGDVINTINGKPIKNLNEIMALFGQIKTIDRFQIGIRRSGQSINKEYNIE